ncbi:MAG: WhiB family transcriptional regulator [Egibacteraceae bacterium]
MSGWRDRAACAPPDVDPDMFFPVGVSGPWLDQIERAKELCRRCDVAAECLEWAVATGQDYGIWGGLDEEERRRLRRTRRARSRRCDQLHQQTGEAGEPGR